MNEVSELLMRVSNMDACDNGDRNASKLVTACNDEASEPR